MKIVSLVAGMGLGIAAHVYAQNNPSPVPELTIRHTTASIVPDGKLDEPDWQKAAVAGQFWQRFPYDTSKAAAATEVKMLFDEHFVYIAAVCYQSKNYVISSLKRDFTLAASDFVGVSIDPFGDRQNGFYFALSPLGVQLEGLITNGQLFTADWDNKWFSKVTSYDDRWIVEMAIPFTTLRYKQQTGQNEWLINFSRGDNLRNEQSSWARIPRNFSATALAFSGKLLWESPPPRPSHNISLIPYGLVEANRDYLSRLPTQTNLNAGFDAKFAVTPSLNLDVTVNPDFAQVEVDQQVTNLSRFELFFPERRQFFLENNDLFSSFGFSTISPFFSRRIGLFRDPTTNFNKKIPILAGVRLSGRLDRNWRIGVLNMQTARQSFGDSIALPSTNFGMVALQRRFGTRSYLSAMLVNKTPVGIQSGDVATAYNRVAGIEYVLASANNRWLMKTFYQRSFTPQNLPQQYAWGINLGYDAPHLNARTTTSDIGDNHSLEMGYLPRRSLLRSSGEANFVFFPKGQLKRLVNRFYLGPDWDFLYGKIQGRLVDWDAGFFGGITLQNQSQLSFALLRWDYTYLFSPFDPTNTGGLALPANTDYLYFSNRVSFTSNVRKPFFYSFLTRFGHYFNGRILQFQSTWSYRFQPIGIVSLDFTYNGIRLPKPYSSSDLFLIGPKFDISFSDKVFLKGVVQYNNQINNVNTNIRFQWRYKPVSDVFVVYTDNYFAYEHFDGIERVQAFQPKNRALVVKMTYWLNL
jgi:hypothetical protein